MRSPNFIGQEKVLEDFLALCKQLKKGFIVQCSFGVDTYTITKMGRESKYLWVINSFPVRIRSFVRVGMFKGIEEIKVLLELYPQMYAADVGGTLIFYDNWINFLKAFKLKSEKDDTRT